MDLPNIKPQKASRKSAPRGRPPLAAAQREEMKQRIAQAAQRLFHEEGYAAVSMRRLAVEVGCTPMTLYAYYANKSQILRHIWVQIFAGVFAKLDVVAAKHRDPTRRLAAVALAYVEYWLSHREHYRIVFMTEGVSQEEVSIFVDEAPTMAHFAVLLEPLAELSTRLTPELQKERADILFCGLHGIAHCLITISPYSWSKPEALVSSLISGIIRTKP